MTYKQAYFTKDIKINDLFYAYQLARTTHMMYHIISHSGFL